MNITSQQMAVMLRQARVPVREVAARTGLSAPTVVALHKAFLAGGINAVNSRKPGRPTGSKAKKGQIAAESHALRGLLPEGAKLWSMSLLADWLGKQRQKPVDVRAAKRAWQQWGWAPDWPSIPASLSSSSAAVPPAAGVWQACVRRVPTGGAWLLCCRNPRNSVFWLCLDHQPLASDYLDWLERLLQLHPAGMTVCMQFPGVTSVKGLHEWLEQHPQMHLMDTDKLTRIELNRIENSEIVNTQTPNPDCARTALLHMNTNTYTMSERLTHLQRLEAESIHILREVVASCRNPVMLYSIGKDSACMLHLALKAFAPARLPFPLLHVDTDWKFREMYAFRDKMQSEHGFELRIHRNLAGVNQGINPFTHGSQIHTDIMKTQALRQALDMYKFDAAFGGARRDEEKSRAKERIFSFRSQNHHWDPKNQRPELWNLYNTHTHEGESLRVFPLSNWTELDIWLYIHQEKIPVVPLYFAKERPVVERKGTLIMVDDDRMPLHSGEVPLMRKVRFRTLGCYPLTGAIASQAQTVPDIIREMLTSRSSEREGRLIDHDGAASMEKKKQEGYF